MAPDLEGFPYRLKLLMDAEELSYRQLSDLTGGEVSHSALAQWVKGENRASLEQVVHVAKVFKWDAHELLFGKPTPDLVDRLAQMDAQLRRIRRATEALVEASAMTARVERPKDGGDEELPTRRPMPRPVRPAPAPAAVRKRGQGPR